MNKFVALFLVLSLIPQFTYAKMSNDPEGNKWWFELMGIYDAWDYTTGSDEVIVAVIDNGVDRLNPDLKENMWENLDEIIGNGIDDDNNGYVDDRYGWSFVPVDLDGDGDISEAELIAGGTNDPRPDIANATDYAKERVIHHGTAVAGIIGAVGNNGLAGTGVNWNVKIMNVQLLGTSGAGKFHPISEAIRYAVDNGADVINMSIVSDQVLEDLEEAIEYAYSKGVVLVAAAGNDLRNLDTSPSYPACIDKGTGQTRILGVTAVDSGRRFALFSNSGGGCIDITGPGVDIESTLIYEPSENFVNIYGEEWSGTSFAAPFVSGVAALIKSVQPNWGADEIYDALLNTTSKTPTEDEEAYARLFGQGLIHAGNAIEYAISRKSFTQLIEKIVMVSHDDGLLTERIFPDKAIRKRSLLALKGVDTVATLRTEGKDRGYVTAELIELDGQIRIARYDVSWNLLSVWRIPATAEATIHYGDVNGDGAHDIVVVPKADYAGVMFSVYDELGNQILSQKGPVASASTLTWNESLKRFDVLTITPNDDGVEAKFRILRYNYQGLQMANHNIEKMDTIDALASGDIDGDGAHEYVIMGKFGSENFLLYMEQSGDVYRRFYAYNAGFTAPLALVVGDIDADGKEDITVMPREGEDPIRVWNYRARKVDEWLNQREEKSTLNVFPIYKN